MGAFKEMEIEKGVVREITTFLSDLFTRLDFEKWDHFEDVAEEQMTLPRFNAETIKTPE